MVDNDIVTSMRVRALAQNMFSVVLVHKNGDRKGYVMTPSKVLEIIDDIEIR